MQEVNDPFELCIPAQLRHPLSCLRFQSFEHGESVRERLGLVAEVFDDVHLQLRFSRPFLEHV